MGTHEGASPEQGRDVESKACMQAGRTRNTAMFQLMPCSHVQRIPAEQLSETEQRNIEVLQAMKESAASSEPIWKVGKMQASADNGPHR